LEPIFYHPIISFCSLRGYLSYLTKRDFKWKKMERAGFKQKQGNANEEDSNVNPEPATI
jgi:glycosyltransferase, group 2 family